MAIELGPVVLDVETPIKNAAAKVPQASKPLEAAIEKEIKRISNAIAKLQKESTKGMGAGGIDEINKKMTTYAHTVELAAKSMVKYGQQQGKLTAGRLDIKALSSEITVLANKWNALKLGSKFDADGKLRVRAQELIDRMSRLTAQTVKFGNALSTSSVKAGKAAERAAAGVNMTNMALTKQSGILSRLTGYLSGYTLLFAGLRFVRNIRETTAEFELQRVALGSIIKDAEQANLLFRQIKAAAIESPFQIKELVTFTKQLSAYRIETENLFDVTMKLADVSAGLGVDMNRLVLAYGQVRAASVLRGQELRQFTEAGIPLVEKLAEKFTYLNGKMVSTADVFKLISQRAVPFEMVAEIFDDMTSAGGEFYKMQEKQAETLAGQWSNLKDALSIMYDEIGNTDTVHKAMSNLIQDAKFLFQNWRTVSQIIKTVAINYGTLKVASLFIPNLAKSTKLAEAATAALAKAQQLEARQEVKQNAIRALSITQLKNYSAQLNKAAVAQTAFGRGWHRLAALMSGGGWVGLAITAVSVLTGWLISAYKESQRLNKELTKIGTEGSLEINRSVSNFIRLANAAVSAADGSDRQNEALAELGRTYSDIIPSQNLQIDNLKKLEGNYASLTRAIEEKINMQIREQKVNAVTDAYSKDITKSRKKTKELLLQFGLNKEQINAVMDEVQKEVDNGLIGINDTAEDKAKALKRIIYEMTGIFVSWGNGFRDFEGVYHNADVSYKKIMNTTSSLVDVYSKLNSQINEINEESKNSVGTMGVYAASWDELEQKIKNVTVSEEKFGKKTTFAFKKEKIRKEVELMAEAIEKAFEGTNIDISKAFDPRGTINFDFLNEAAVGSNKWGLNAFIKKVQKSYEDIVPTERMVSVVEEKFKELAKAAGLSMDDVQGYLLRGNKDVRTYVKDLQDDLQEAKDKVSDLGKQAEMAKKTTVVPAPSEDEIKKANSFVEFLETLISWLDAYKKKTKEDAYAQDPFIKQIQERMKFMKDFQKGYDEFRKYMSDTSALEKESGIMKFRGQALGLSIDDQNKAAKNLSEWYSTTMADIFKRVQEKYHITGDLEYFLSQEIKDTTNRGKALKDFQELLQSLFDAKTDFDTSQEKENIEKALAKLKDDIKRSETARNFYNNILGLTGDKELAETLTVSVYGTPGEEFADRIKKQLVDSLTSLDANTFAGLDDAIRNAFGEGDIEYLMKNLSKVPENLRDVIKQIASDSEKYNGDLAKNFAELISKYGTTQQKIDTIRARAKTEVDDLTKARDRALKKEGLTPQQVKKINETYDAIIESIEGKARLDEFVAGEDYIKFFSELNVMTVKQASVVRTELRKAYLDAFNKGAISADELYRNLRAIDTQFKKLTEDTGIWGSYLTGGFEKANQKLQEYADNVMVLAEKMKSGKQLDEGEQAFATKMIKQFGSNSEQTKGFQNYQQFISSFSSNGEGVKEAGEAFSQMGEGMSAMASDGPGAIAIIDAIFKGVNGTITGIQEFINELNRMRSEENKVGGWFKYLTDWNKYINEGWEKVKSGDVVGATMNLASAVTSIFNNIKEDKIEEINDKIDDQSDLIDDLDYQYGRLQVSIEKAFGSDYIANYNKQLEVLMAKQDAYLEQARLERDKGKNADENVAKGYEKQARDVADVIAGMQSQLSEFFSGSDLTSAAKDFANSWIEAYKQFGNTTGAIKEKFQDMVEEMITNSLAAKIMQEQLQPIFDEIDRLAKEGGELSVDDVAAIASMAAATIPNMNDALTTLMTQLQAAGVNLRTQPGQFTGIARNIASASEESINGLAAGINTQNFYMQHIDATVTAILAHLTGGAVVTNEGAAGSVTNPYQEEMLSVPRTYLPQMSSDLSNIYAILRQITSDNRTKSVWVRM